MPDTNRSPNSESNSELVLHDDNLACYACEEFLVEPYIRCAECEEVTLCKGCFAQGREKNEHQSDHDYRIVQNDFPVVEDSDWTAREERSLLGLIQYCGLGNWTNVARKLPGRSPEDCRKHYFRHYVDDPCLPDLPRVRSRVEYVDRETVPYAFTLKHVEKPPRYLFDTPNYNLMSGYNAARSDFEVNHDNDAELIVSKLNTKDVQCALGRSLQIALFSSYNMRLGERARRKRIVRDHGLISVRKGIAHLQRYSTELPASTLEKFLIFSQLLKGIEFDAIMLCFHKIGSLKRHIRELKGYRTNGLRNFHDIPLFEELSSFRKESDKLKKVYPVIDKIDSENFVIPITRNPIAFTHIQRRRKAAPIEIHPGMPGFRELSEDEVKLCSECRIEPKYYLEYKNQLRNENDKNGPVKLSKARVLLKIDVNKTREIYDFLKNKGFITTE